MWKVQKVVDLSLPLTNKTQVYPGDPEPDIRVATTIEKDGYNLHYVNIGSQTGTHVDAPYHFLQEGKTIEKVDLSYFIGEGVIVNVQGKKEREEITLEDIKPVEPLLEPGVVVLFNTNWYRKEGTPEYLDHPFISAEACRYLLDKGILTFGIDAINIDPTGGTEFPVHDMISEKGGIIVENMANLDKVDFEHPLVAFFPLKLVGCDGAPVRAAAMQLQKD